MVDGYQFDKVLVSPEADARLYNFLSARQNLVLKGYKNEMALTTSGLNVYIDTGYALVAGRLIFIDVKTQLTAGANSSGYVVLTIDLTKNNTASGTPGAIDYAWVNNQVRVELVSQLTLQDLMNDGQIYTFPLATYRSDALSISITKIQENYEQSSLSLGEKFAQKEDKHIDTDWVSYTALMNGYSGALALKRKGNLVGFKMIFKAKSTDRIPNSIHVLTPASIFHPTQSWTYMAFPRTGETAYMEDYAAKLEFYTSGGVYISMNTEGKLWYEVSGTYMI